MCRCIHVGAYGKGLKEWGLLSIEKKEGEDWGVPPAAFNCPEGVIKETESRFIPEPHSERTQGNGHKLQQRETSQLGTRNECASPGCWMTQRGCEDSCVGVIQTWTQPWATWSISELHGSLLIYCELIPSVPCWQRQDLSKQPAPRASGLNASPIFHPLLSPSRKKQNCSAKLLPSVRTALTASPPGSQQDKRPSTRSKPQRGFVLALRKDCLLFLHIFGNSTEPGADRQCYIFVESSSES